MKGSNGPDVLMGFAGNDTLEGGSHNDILDGGAGNDTLNGGAGNDTYLFGRGDGQDSIDEGWSGDDSRLNTLQFKDGITAQDIIATRNGNHLVLKISGTSDQVTVNDFFYSHPSSNPWNAIQQVKFADETTFNAEQIAQVVKEGGNFPSPDLPISQPDGSSAHEQNATAPLASALNDTLTGSASDDILNGLGGDDVIHAGAGNDVLAGGAGNDILAGGQGDAQLFGGSGNDVYVFLNGDGNDLIVEDATDRTALDVVQLRELASTDTYSLSRVGNDLHLSYAQQRIVVRDQFAEQGFAIEELHFSDGVVLGAQALSQQVQTPALEAASNTTALRQAMAGFAVPPVAGQSSLLAERSVLAHPVLSRS